jgi:hypothetical protein
VAGAVACSRLRLLSKHAKPLPVPPPHASQGFRDTTARLKFSRRGYARWHHWHPLRAAGASSCKPCSPAHPPHQPHSLPRLSALTSVLYLVATTQCHLLSTCINDTWLTQLKPIESGKVIVTKNMLKTNFQTCQHMYTTLRQRWRSLFKHETARHRPRTFASRSTRPLKSRPCADKYFNGSVT